MKKIDKHMIATTAIHVLGDISRELEPEEFNVENLCRVTEEDDENYYGMWVTGLGFINVQFPKETTRELTQEEKEYFNTRAVQIGSQPPMRLKVD